MAKAKMKGGVRRWTLKEIFLTYVPVEPLKRWFYESHRKNSVLLEQKTEIKPDQFLKEALRDRNETDGYQSLIKTPRKSNETFSSMRSRNARIGTMFVLPFIIGFLVFMIGPLVESLMMSFSSVTIVRGSGYESQFIGFTNYKYALSVDPEFNTFLVDEIGRMAINAISTLVLSFVIAVILNQNFKGRTAARAIFFLPVILASGVLPGIEAQIGSNQEITMIESVAEELSSSSGINISETLQELLSVSGVAGSVFQILFDMIDAIYDIVMASGIQIIVFLSGLQAISPSLYEAADMEGCTAWESFWKITFPMVSPLLLVNCIYTIIDFFMKNDNKVMELINEVMYKQVRFGESAAMSWIYFAIALSFIAVSSVIITRGVHYYED